MTETTTTPEADSVKPGVHTVHGSDQANIILRQTLPAGAWYVLVTPANAQQLRTSGLTMEMEVKKRSKKAGAAQKVKVIQLEHTNHVNGDRYFRCMKTEVAPVVAGDMPLSTQETPA